MQTNPRTPARKAPKFLDAKIMIAVLSAAVTVGFWNLFAGQAAAPETTPPNPQPEQVEEEAQAGLSPLPTLVPLVILTDATGASPADQTGPLRSVEAPGQTVVQKNRPRIESPAVVVTGGSPGRGVRPAATTRSSR